jgi:hypothetical protein
VPLNPPGSDAVLMANTGGGALIVTVQVEVAEAEFWSVTLTPKLKLPAVVGVPEICPEAEIDNPGGNCPLASAQVYGGVPPAALRVAT